MKLRLKHILAAFGSAVLFVGTMGTLLWTGRQFEFFSGQDGFSTAYVEASEREQWVQDLSGEIGIHLDPALEKHAELLAQRDRLVVCPETIQFTPQEEGWFQGSVDRSRYVFSEQSLPEDPLFIYTGGFTADGYDVRMALIGMDTCLVAGVEVPAFEVAIEIRPESRMFPANIGEMKVGMAGFGHFNWHAPDEEETYQAAYLYAADAGVWFEKRMDYGMISHGSVPSLMLGAPSGGHFGWVDLFQLWGTANLALLSAHTLRVQVDLYRDDSLWAGLGFWYPDGLYQQQGGEGLK